MLLLTLHVGVQQAHVALAASPEHIALSAELDSGVDSGLDLEHRACCDVEVGVGGSAVHVALVAEYVCSTPQELDTGLGLLLLRVLYDSLHVGLVLLGSGGLVDKVYIMEAVVLETDLLHDLEACVHLVLGPLESGSALVPGEGLGAAAELVAALGAEGVPPCQGELQPVLHLLAGYDLLGVIVMKCKRVL